MMATATITQTTEQQAVAAWEAATARNQVVYDAADALCAPYVCIGGFVWNTPPAIEALDTLLHSGEWPVRPWDKNFSVAKVLRGARAMDRYTRRLEQALSAAR